MSTRSEPRNPADVDHPESWVDQHGEYLFRYAMHRVSQRAVAEEVVQETLLAGLQSVESFDGRSTLRTWLTSILRHKIGDHFRRDGREPVSAGLDQLERWADGLFSSRGKWCAVPPRFKWPKSPDEQSELLVALRDCLEKLPAHTAEVFVLHDHRRVPPEELAASIGISAGSLAARMYRARLALRSCLEQNWFAGECR